MKTGQSVVWQELSPDNRVGEHRVYEGTIDGKRFVLPEFHIKHYSALNAISGIDGNNTYGEWGEQVMQRLLIGMMQHDDVFLDIGANLGFYSLIASSRCEKVHAFEPHAGYFKFLKVNVPAKVICYPFALSDSMTTCYLNGGLEMVNTETPFPIKTARLDSFHLNPTIVKIDVEGAALKVWEGGATTLKRARMIFVELHDENEKTFLDVIQPDFYPVPFGDDRAICIHSDYTIYDGVVDVVIEKYESKS